MRPYGPRNPQPSQENNMYTSGGGQFGGPLARSGQSNSGASSLGYGPPGPMSPTGRTVLEGYRNEIMNGFQKESPRYNPSNTSRPQSSTLVNFNDAIQVHLLVETALDDSKEFEILSPEEVDDLKKQIKALSQRIDTTRQNLAIQSKYRDAAISMAKLYSPADRKRSVDSSGKRRSFLGNRNSGSEQVQEADRERMASERKCEDLALELWNLEKRLLEPQSRLLKHTAGILQMTHKGPKKVLRQQGSQQTGAMPGSPESIYTYHNGRVGVDPIEEDIFDDRSLYRSADKLDGFGGAIDRRDSMDPVPAPLRSPVREQTSVYIKSIENTESILQILNKRLRDVIVKSNPQNNTNYKQPPPVSAKKGEPGDGLDSHLTYLEQGITKLDQDQDYIADMFEAKESEMEETVEGLNREVRSLLIPYGQDRPAPPQLTGKGNGIQGQLDYFQDIVGDVEVELSRTAKSANSTSRGQTNNLEQFETVLMGVWEIIQSGQAEIRTKKAERRQTRTAQGYPIDEDDMSDDDGGNPNEPFSLPAFSAKVQYLYAQATSLKDQKKVLQRQIKQQRELNSKSDATKDAEMAQKTEDLERVKSLLTRTESDADSVRLKLSEVLKKLDEARQRENLRMESQANSETSSIRAVKDELAARNEQYAAVQEQLSARTRDLQALEEEIQDLKDEHSIGGAEIQSQLAEAEVRIGELTSKMQAIIVAQGKSEEVKALREKELSEKEAEMEGLFEKVAELQTEVTIARAELDGAYGSRAQRAAEVAANPVIQKEIDELARRNASLTAEIAALQAAKTSAGSGNDEALQREKMLKKELAETIEDYELMTKASIDWEKEREDLERTIDKLRDERERLEAQLSDEKVRWLGMNSPGLEGVPPGPGSTSTTVLKNEFKKMMRDTRTENAKALRAEQEQRRRLEEDLRNLRKQLGPGRSGLSQSMASPLR